MWPVLAVSEGVVVALVSFAGVTVTALGTVVVALLTRNLGQRRRQVHRAMDDFEAAWERRGELVEGLSSDLDAMGKRVVAVEEREARCQERLVEAEARLAQIEAR